jgi:tRNA acetyltransferase TAN1
LNLIITCARHLEQETEQEIRNILKSIGDPNPTITITRMSGILTADTMLESTEIIKEIKERLLDEPWSIRYCLRIIPIQKITETNLDSIEKEVSNMTDLIADNETYRISVEKRNSDISGQELISKIAKNIKNNVSLEFPDKIILIEILGNKTGLAIIKKSDILSIEKTKRSMSE